MGKDNCVECITDEYGGDDISKELLKAIRRLGEVIQSLPRTKRMYVLLSNGDGSDERFLEYNHEDKIWESTTISSEDVAEFYEKFSDETLITYCPQCEKITEG